MSGILPFLPVSLLCSGASDLRHDFIFPKDQTISCKLCIRDDQHVFASLRVFAFSAGIWYNLSGSKSAVIISAPCNIGRCSHSLAARGGVFLFLCSVFHGISYVFSLDYSPTMYTAMYLLTILYGGQAVIISKQGGAGSCA